MSRNTIIILIALWGFMVAIWFSTPVDANAANKCNARCWYLKYHKEKRKVNRLNKLLHRIDRGATRLRKESRPWTLLAWCESTGRWNLNTGNGFHGGLQFSPGTWRAYGGSVFSRHAHQATAIQQAAIAQKVLRKQGRRAWPGCTAKGAW